jgi:hypothetical protein
VRRLRHPVTREDPPMLTIGIPTYNRVDDVARLLKDLLAHPASQAVRILVIDDGGSDDTQRKLLDDPAIASRVRVLTNDANLGYAHTFARIFAECGTEYVMLMADDDEVVAENLPALLEYLERERPAFAAPQFLRGSTLYRGRTSTEPIAPRDVLLSCTHAPGLVYRVDDCRAGLEQLAERARSGIVDALVYPQVGVVMRLLAEGRKCEWLGMPTVVEGTGQPSGIRDARGHIYWSVESRWQQLKSFDALLSGFAEWDTTGASDEMLRAQRERVFSTIATAIRLDDPALGAAFDSGARKIYEKTVPAPPTAPPTFRSLIRSLPMAKWAARRVRRLRRFAAARWRQGDGRGRPHRRA